MKDRGTIIGLVATGGLLLWVMLSGTGFSLEVFWRTPSIGLVVGGSILVTMIAYPLGRFRELVPVLRKAFTEQKDDPVEHVAILVAMAEIARRDGLLALERSVQRLPDSFLKRGMQMTIDGAEPAVVEKVLQTEMESTDLRHTECRGLVRSVGQFAPVFGMIGTLIGLVVMLGQMEDPSKIGPGMAVALLTTLYGLIFANVVCLPLAKKLGRRSSAELMSKTLILTGVLAIQAGDHPRVVEQKLRAYLPGAGRGHSFGRAAARSRPEQGKPAERKSPPRQQTNDRQRPPTAKRKIDKAA